MQQKEQIRISYFVLGVRNSAPAIFLDFKRLYWHLQITCFSFGSLESKWNVAFVSLCVKENSLVSAWMVWD